MAIAFDTATNPALANATSNTVAHTCTGTDRFLYVSVWMRAVTCTGVTYGGVAMTEIGTRVLTGDSDYIAHYYLKNPASGSNNIVASFSGSNYSMVGAASYTGVDQTSPLDANNNRAATTSSNLTTSVTTVADNCWVLASVRAHSDGVSAAGTGTTQRATVSGYTQMYDKNSAVTPAGSASINTTQLSQPVVHLLASIKPATSVVSNYYSPSGGVAYSAGVQMY